MGREGCAGARMLRGDHSWQWRDIEVLPGEKAAGCRGVFIAEKILVQRLPDIIAFGVCSPAFQMIAKAADSAMQAVKRHGEQTAILGDEQE